MASAEAKSGFRLGPARYHADALRQFAGVLDRRWAVDAWPLSLRARVVVLLMRLLLRAHGALRLTSKVRDQPQACLDARDLDVALAVNATRFQAQCAIKARRAQLAQKAPKINPTVARCT